MKLIINSLTPISTFGYWDDWNIIDTEMLLISTFGWFPQNYFYSDNEREICFSSIDNVQQEMKSSIQTTVNFISNLRSQ